MLSTPSGALLAGVQAVPVAAAALGLGYLVVDAFLGARDVARLTRWGLAFVGFMGLSLAVMLGHFATGGWLLSTPLATRIVLSAVSAGLVAVKVTRRRQGVRWRQSELFLAAGVVVAGLVVWAAPVFRLLPLHFSPDTNLHVGWTAQLLNGFTTPSATVTGDVPNYYPWLYHSALGMLSHITPGGHPFHALGPLQVVQVTGLLLALAAFGRAVTGKLAGGGAAVLLGGLAGGFGILQLFELDSLSTSTAPGSGELFWLGDVFARRPYSFAFNNLPPAFPRDVSFALFVSLLLLLFLARTRSSRAVLAAAGITLGLIALTGGEALIIGGVIALIFASSAETGRVAGPIIVVGTALITYACWLIPFVAGYVRYDGLVNLTHVGPVDRSANEIVVSFGIAVPLAIFGGALMLRTGLLRPGALLCALVLTVPALLIVVNSALFSEQGALLTLARDHRYWLFVSLGVALIGAFGAAELVERVAASRLLSAAAIGGVVALGVAAPFLASLFMHQVRPQHPLIGSSLRRDSPTALNALASVGPGRCNAAVPVPRLGRVAFSFTGFRLVQWIELPGSDNSARIRWAGIYEHIPGEDERRRDNVTLTMGLGDPDEWQSLARKYDVDAVIAPAGRADADVFEAFEQQPVAAGDSDFVLMRIRPCPGMTDR